MSDEVQEIERLIKQVGELGEWLVRLARKLQEQNLQRSKNYQDDSANLVASDKKRKDETSYSDAIGSQHNHDADYAKALPALLGGTMSPQKAAVDLLCAAVADKTMTPDQATSEISKLLRRDLPVSRRIALREDLKAAFQADDDVANRIRSFLENGIEQAEQRGKVHERGLTPADTNPV